MESVVVLPVSVSGMQPSIDQVNIIGERDAEIAILDISGRTVCSFSIGRGQFVSFDLSPGLYHLLDLGNGQSVCRAVVLEGN